MSKHIFAQDIRGNVSNRIAPALVANLTTGPASVRQAFNTGANRDNLLRLAVSAACWITFGNSSVTATAANGIYLPANAVDYLAVPDGATHVAVIQDTAAGVLSIATAVKPQP